MSKTTKGALDPVFATHDAGSVKQNNNNSNNNNNNNNNGSSNNNNQTPMPYYNQPPAGYDRSMHPGYITTGMTPPNPGEYPMMAPPRFAPNGTSVTPPPGMSTNGAKGQVHPPTRSPVAGAPAEMLTTFNSKTVSTTPKRYKCTICEKRFTRPSSLQTHMYSHTGEKPFKCPVEGCGRHFSVASNLRRHQKIHANPPPVSQVKAEGDH